MQNSLWHSFAVISSLLLALSLSLSSAHYYGRHIALINGAECVRLNFQFACNDLIVHNFVIWLTQIPLNDNDFMQFMGRACRAVPQTRVL